MRALIVSSTRIFSFVVFFGPFLGVMDSLAHWFCEKIALDLDYQNTNRYGKGETINMSTSILHYHDNYTGRAEQIRFSNIYRSNYSNPEKPTPPGYEVYTLVKLHTAYLIFAGILLLQSIANLVIKIILSPKFRKAPMFKKFTHIVESLNLPDCYKSWDEDEDEHEDEDEDKDGGSSEEYKERYKKGWIEITTQIFVHFLFNLLLQVPVYITGKCVNVYENIIISIFLLHRS